MQTQPSGTPKLSKFERFNRFAIVLSALAALIVVIGFIQGLHIQWLIPNPFSPWQVYEEAVPETGTTIAVNLTAGQTLMLTGGAFQVDGAACSGVEGNICVLLFEANVDQSVQVAGLTPRHNWLGISSRYNADQALQDRRPTFWEPPNCVNGCRSADVFVCRDGTCDGGTTISPP